MYVTAGYGYRTGRDGPCPTQASAPMRSCVDSRRAAVDIRQLACPSTVRGLFFRVCSVPATPIVGRVLRGARTYGVGTCYSPHLTCLSVLSFSGCVPPPLSRSARPPATVADLGGQVLVAPRPPAGHRDRPGHGRWLLPTASSRARGRFSPHSAGLARKGGAWWGSAFCRRGGDTRRPTGRRGQAAAPARPLRRRGDPPAADPTRLTVGRGPRRRVGSRGAIRPTRAGRGAPRGARGPARGASSATCRGWHPSQGGSAGGQHRRPHRAGLTVAGTRPRPQLPPRPVALYWRRRAKLPRPPLNATLPPPSGGYRRCTYCRGGGGVDGHASPVTPAAADANAP